MEVTDGAPVSRMHPDDLAELKDALRGGAAARDKAPFVATGSDPVMFREVANTLFEEKLRLRGLKDDGEIRAIAKEVARQVVAEDLATIEKRISTFLTSDEIKRVVLSALNDVGLRADDDEHRFDTRTRLTKLFKDQDDRRDNIKTLAKETLKGFVGQAMLIGAGFMAWFFSQRTGGH